MLEKQEFDLPLGYWREPVTHQEIKVVAWQ